MSLNRPKVLIWGISGASLGMEIAKCLRDDGGFEIHGCDISRYAYGHFDPCFETTYFLDERDCRPEVASILEREEIDFLVAGGDLVARICSDFDISSTGARHAGNSPDVARVCSDKFECFEMLGRRGLACPWTVRLSSVDLDRDGELPFPVVVKPLADSGGSRDVSVALDRQALEEILATHREVADGFICQEYLTDSGNELTVGVLSNSSGKAAGAILLRRMFHSMLSVNERSDGYLISSGFTQGRVFRDPGLEAQAMEIAESVGSVGPLNIQCRVKEGRLVPFEINPRFSASTYLRALAGVNEPALFLRHLLNGEDMEPPEPREGLLLRSFDETFVEGGG